MAQSNRLNLSLFRTITLGQGAASKVTPAAKALTEAGQASLGKDTAGASASFLQVLPDSQHLLIQPKPTVLARS